MWYRSPNWILQDGIVFSFTPNENRIFLQTHSIAQLPIDAYSQLRAMCVHVCVCCLWAELDLCFEGNYYKLSLKEVLFSTDEGSFPFNFILPIMITKVQQLIMFYCWSLHIIVTFFLNSTMQFGWFRFSPLCECFRAGLCVCVLFIQHVCAGQRLHSCLFSAHLCEHVFVCVYVCM